MSEVNVNLPSDWRISRLTDVVELNPRRFTQSISDEDALSFVPMKAVEEESGLLSASNNRRWIEVKKGYTSFQDGDVIFAKITPCMENGKFALARNLIGGRAAGSTEFHVLRHGPDLNPEYLLHFLFNPELRRNAKRSMRGAAGQLRVPAIFFDDIEIRLPSLAEQQRIVAEIEKQFTRLDAGVAALKRAQANLKPLCARMTATRASDNLV
jgi:type I restriction enzyme, S subunit